MNVFGELLRKIRRERDDRLLDLAERVGKSVAFVSAVERGAKVPGADFDRVVADAYSLNGLQRDELRRALSKSRDTFVIEPRSELGRDTASLLARSFDTLEPDQVRRIRKILEE